MLQIVIPAVEFYDELKEEFVIGAKEQTLQLEHSLVSVSKWESKWCKAFLSKRDKTSEELLDYIKCMTITKNVSDDVYDRLTEENVKQIENYINAPMSATYFRDEQQGSGGKDVTTSELIYHWMISFNIPFDPCQKWHLNRLLTLIRVCSVKNQSPGHKNPKEIAKSNAQLNAARRKQWNTRG